MARQLELPISFISIRKAWEKIRNPQEDCSVIEYILTYWYHASLPNWAMRRPVSL